MRDGHDPHGHLRAADPVLRELIDTGGRLDPREFRGEVPAGAYGALLRAIVGQQLSTTAARAIYGRVRTLFGGRDPTPDELLAADPDELRSAGLSRAKVRYVHDLAARVRSGELQLDGLEELPDDGVVARLTTVRGIGRWSADMFLIFHLGRPDVLPVGDLGLRRAVERAYSLSALPGPAELERIGQSWRPYRTLASLYLWRSLANAPV